MVKSKSCNAESSENSAIPGSGLHKRSLSFIPHGDVAGFTLIEVLIVILVVGILIGTGLSHYSGTIRYSQLRTRTDALTSFFAACRHRAMLRKTPVKFVYANGNLGTDQSHNLGQRIPEIDTKLADRLFNHLHIEKDGRFRLNGALIERLHLPLKLPGGQTSIIVIEL